MRDRKGVLEDTVMVFGLTYTPTLNDITKHLWNIEADIKTFQLSTLVKFLPGLIELCNDEGRY